MNSISLEKSECPARVDPAMGRPEKRMYRNSGDQGELLTRGLSLQQICKDVCGIQVSLGLEVADMIRIAHPVPPTSVLPDSRSCDSARKQIARTFPGLDLGNSWVQVKKPTPTEENLCNRYMSACAEFSAHRMAQATRIADVILGDIKGGRTTFKRKLRADCRLLLASTAHKGDIDSLNRWLVEARRITRKYLAIKDYLGVAFAQLVEAQIARGLAWLNPEHDTDHFRAALRALDVASNALNRKFPSLSPETLISARHLEIFHRARILNEFGDHKAELPCIIRLRESAPQIRGGLGLLERARSEASHFMETRDYDRTAQAVAELAWLYDNTSHRPAVAMFCCLGRLAKLCQLTGIRFSYRDYEALLPSFEEEKSEHDYVRVCHERFKRLYRDPERWEQLAVPACFVARISSIYLEPKFINY
jgi:hypothetical protein